MTCSDMMFLSVRRGLMDVFRHLPLTLLLLHQASKCKVLIFPRWWKGRSSRWVWGGFWGLSRERGQGWHVRDQRCRCSPAGMDFVPGMLGKKRVKNAQHDSVLLSRVIPLC